MLTKITHIHRAIYNAGRNNTVTVSVTSLLAEIIHTVTQDWWLKWVTQSHYYCWLQLHTQWQYCWLKLYSESNSDTILLDGISYYTWCNSITAGCSYTKSTINSNSHSDILLTADWRLLSKWILTSCPPHKVPSATQVDLSAGKISVKRSAK